MRIAVSIIICTRNRAESLRETLVSLKTIDKPVDLAAELLIIDNGSTDSTESLVSSFRIPSVDIRYLSEPRIGQSRARNRGMAAAQGSVILFTDDDIRFPFHWLEAMCRPILSAETDAVVGGVAIAPHLQRSWMTPHNRSWLASTEELSAANPSCMVGANMSFAREVLAKVPSFDECLGPGALGFGDDTLFSCQLLEAGFRISSAFDIPVEHHFDPGRLNAATFRRMAERMGRKTAYIFYHWQHQRISQPAIRALRSRLKRVFVRATSRSGVDEAPPLSELRQYQWVGLYAQAAIEQKLARHYDPLGLVKRHRDSSVSAR